MLLDNVPQTIGISAAALARAHGKAEGDRRAPDLHLESLGIEEAEKRKLLLHARNESAAVDPVVAHLLQATCGHSYAHLLGKSTAYPIPELRLPAGGGRRLLDIGCSWGRWSIAAARKGYVVVGLDPSLGAVLAARRVAAQLGLENRYVVGDARYLPFPSGCFDTIFSYSVLQHFSKEHAMRTLHEIARTLRADGTSLVQMANAVGLRSVQHQLRRRFRQPRDFEVRYWTVPELQRSFDAAIGPSVVSVDCYFGLGLQASDIDLMPPFIKLVIRLSELLRRCSTRFPPLRHLADSVYVTSSRQPSRQAGA